MESTTDALKSQLESIERELMQLNVRRQHTAPAKEVASKASSPITRNGFIMAQERGRAIPHELQSPVAPLPSGRKAKQKVEDEYLMDLIARPRPSRSQSRHRPPAPSRYKSSSEYDDSQSVKLMSNKSSDMEDRTTLTRSLNDRFEARVNAERQRMDAEFGIVVDKLRQELDEARHKRLCERDAFRETKDRLEREIRDMRYQLENAEVSARSSKQEATLLKVQVEELRAELKQATCEFERMELRCAKMCEGNEEIVARIKHEKSRVEAVLAEKEKEVTNLSRENAKWRRREEEVLSKGIVLADRNSELAKEVNSLKDLVDDVKHKSANEIERSEEKVAELMEECNELQSLLTDCKQSKNQLEERTAGLSREISRLREENGTTLHKCDGLERELKQLRRAADENSHLRAERLALDSKCHQQQDQITRLQDALGCRDREMEKLRSELREVDAKNDKLSRQVNMHFSRQPQPLTASAKSNREVDLIDNEATPLSKLGKCPQTAPRAERPPWWHQEDDIPIKRSIILPSRSAPAVVSDEDDDEPPPRLVHPSSEYGRRERQRVPIRDIPNASETSSSLELLKCEKQDLFHTLQKLPRNAAFRTSEQNEQWQALQGRIREVESDLTTLTIDREIS